MFSLNIPPKLPAKVLEAIEQSTELFRRQLGVFAQQQFIQEYRSEITRLAELSYEAGMDHTLKMLKDPK